jgi:putative PIN family toxin of toxin-antitoxin system
MALPARLREVLIPPVRPIRVVLDTNVWIDWLVFDDEATAPLREAHRRARIEIVADEACLEEFDRVLAYPEFKLDYAQRRTCRAQLERCIVRHEHGPPAGATSLPRCSDPDDQKFLALACGAQADWLLTRDKALLRLARRLKSLGVRIGSPLDFADNLNARGRMKLIRPK